MFWRSSPKELAWETEAARARIQRRTRERRESAWLVASLSRTKKIPKLETLTNDDDAPKRPQTWQEMKAALMKFKGNHVDG